MIDLSALTIAKAAAALRAKEFSSRELVEAHLSLAHEKNPSLNAYLELFEESALAEADEADKRITAGEEGSLLGIPIGVKDNILIKDKISSGGSKILATHRAVYDATVISRLREQGAVFLGRTNLDEFGMGSSTENSAYGPTKNPHDLTRVPGGSSGGSTAALAAHIALGALGTDTGGSCRQPAALCGVVGMKPTYGAVSRYGVMPLGASLNQVGEMAKTVADVETLFHAVRSHDKMDNISCDYEARRFKATPTQAKRVGVPRKFLEKGLPSDVVANFEASLARLRERGYEVVDIELPFIDYALAVYYVLLPAEISTDLARYDGMRYGVYLPGANLLKDYMRSRGEGFGKESRRRIMLGTYVLSHGYYDAYYNKARAIRQAIVSDFKRVFSGPEAVGAIATPTTAAPAFKIGEKVDDPLAMYLEDIFTVTANIVGCPAISVPSGTVDREGVRLPLGFQLMAPHFGEELMFAIAKDAEGNTV
ncbi:MAG: Asp-tRNA(Asn)/Glu-tRNA(Gln) amidotransferase GatCAB subunit A [Candidatus Vogelbacteria bacterium CG10_big_fil_rev_8_21_14_0_10_51_16]|uniref:Glutamyl-tRNA(Gln) amidotransferase subunit A n=1 Tax=Candidatus Vogelbacteria bacterium CG10_big_fil_rev_8_21_14_0_10_51_16 TaxID=1975045 RepID=A0A2H0RFB8_9BACT|nr:MAG: Asp-tRNA(Asn)/Glu-tRNA(Gln) amidotransferase GatCAB subunit A [Candidatus Vogelbacteria bacterium CG10_big_fil_rev_8_21_14_0_10_51_16]